MNDSEIIKALTISSDPNNLKSCWDCIHCDVCANIDGFSHHVSDVSKCKHFKGKADVEPVKHAAFVRDEEHWYICGNCHHATCSEFDLEGEYKKIEINGKVETIYALKQPNYCKHCGSKMDGKEVQE